MVADWNTSTYARRANSIADSLTSDDSQASGFSGCNQFMGGFTVEGDQLSFGPLASTRKMCIEGMEQASFSTGSRSHLLRDTGAMFGLENRRKQS